MSTFDVAMGGKKFINLVDEDTMLKLILEQGIAKKILKTIKDPLRNMAMRQKNYG